MKKKINLAVLLNEEFVPLGEDKEGLLRGGFAALQSSPNNCNCDEIGNNCMCNGNNCNKEGSTLNSNCACGGNNCSCYTYKPSSSSSSSEDGKKPDVPSETFLV